MKNFDFVCRNDDDRLEAHHQASCRCTLLSQLATIATIAIIQRNSSVS